MVTTKFYAATDKERERGLKVWAVTCGSGRTASHVFFRQRRAVSPGRAQILVDVHHGVAGVTGEAGTLRRADADGVRRVADLVPQRSRSGDSRHAKGGEICASGGVEAAAAGEVNVGTRHSAVVHGAHINCYRSPKCRCVRNRNVLAQVHSCPTSCGSSRRLSAPRCAVSLLALATRRPGQQPSRTGAPRRVPTAPTSTPVHKQHLGGTAARTTLPRAMAWVLHLAMAAQQACTTNRSPPLAARVRC